MNKFIEVIAFVLLSIGMWLDMDGLAASSNRKTASE